MIKLRSSPGTSPDFSLSFTATGVEGPGLSGLHLAKGAFRRPVVSGEGLELQ